MLARLMVGTVTLAAARLSVVIGAISQGFGGVYQDRFSFADYLSGTESGHLRPCHANAMGPDHDAIYTAARAERDRSLHRPGRHRPERGLFRRAHQCGAQT